MADILREIEDSEKESKLNRILSRSALGIFILGVVIVLYLGISSWYANKQNESIEEDGSKLTNTVNKINSSKAKDNTDNEHRKLEEINQAEVKKLETLAEAGTSAYSALANIYLASIALIDGNPSKGVYYYQRISRDNSYSDTLREYAEIVEINTKLQFNKEVYDTPMKQIYEYFASYINDTGTVDHKIFHQKKFSNAFAITGIALEDITGKLENSKLYIEALNEYETESENVNLLIDVLSQYLAQKINNEGK